MKNFGELREIRDNELELMLGWRNSHIVRANMYNRHEISLEEHLLWWEKTRLRLDQKYFIYERNGNALGIVGFTLIDYKNRNSSWAFYASPDAPRGSGSFMEFLALEYVFRDLSFNKLYCEVLSFNVAVIKLHKKFGFQTEGIFRDHHMVDEHFVDIYRLGILANEWGENRLEILQKLKEKS